MAHNQPSITLLLDE